MQRAMTRWGRGGSWNPKKKRDERRRPKKSEPTPFRLVFPEFAHLLCLMCFRLYVEGFVWDVKFFIRRRKCAAEYLRMRAAGAVGGKAD